MTSPPNPASRVLPEPPQTSGIKKRKKKDDLVIATETDPDDTSAGLNRSTKRAKLVFYDGADVDSTPVVKPKPEKKKKTKGDKDPVFEVTKTKGKSEETEAVKDKNGKRKQAAEPLVPEDDEGSEAVEDSEQNSPSSDSEEDDNEYIPPVHESLAGAAGPDSASSSKKNKKYAPADETPAQRDSRTIFVGNVSSQVMTTKVSRCQHTYPGCLN